MSDLPDETKLHIVASFLKDSPPGEINDVFNDVRVLMDDEALLENGVVSFFEDYNVEQFTTVVPPGKDYKVILSASNRTEEADRFVDPRGSISFAVDHIRQTTSDPQPTEPNAETEPFRHALDEAATKYVSDHYPEGTVTVFGDLGFAIVGNKYNPNSFWNGRWRSQWSAPNAQNEIKGTLTVNVHYYEDGNVQLTASKEIAVIVPPSNDPAAYAQTTFRLITKAEGEFQAALCEKLADLADTIFKTLRRALPITRNKINWDSIATYKIGSELSAK
ncbi:F-actin-capping protein subunit alpha [Powellomyces hirtus]|nr:F-actin-capping protein subunit alpha [Powellomyces hirtus]